MSYRIAVADHRHADAVFDVRRTAYRAAPEFDWKDEAALEWNAADDAGTVLGLWDAHGALQSTLRASVFSRREAAEAFLEYSLEGAPVVLPTLVFSRAATRPESARHGLFAMMRVAYLQALPETSVQSLSAIVYDGGPRLRGMAEVGYTFSEPRAAWDSEAVARRPPLVAVLTRERFAAALAAARAALGEPRPQLDIDTAGIAAGLASQSRLEPM